MFTPIEWYSEPVAFAVKNQILPPFSVLCKKFISDSLVIVVHGSRLNFIFISYILKKKKKIY